MHYFYTSQQHKRSMPIVLIFFILATLLTITVSVIPRYNASAASTTSVFRCFNIESAQRGTGYSDDACSKDGETFTSTDGKTYRSSDYSSSPTSQTSPSDMCRRIVDTSAKNIVTSCGTITYQNSLTSITVVNKSEEAVDNARVNATYDAFGGTLEQVKSAYYKSLGSKAPCSSQGCNDTTWKQMVYDCWSKGRSDAATTARLSGQAGVKVDEAALTKDTFSSCLATKMNGSGIASGDIKGAIGGIDAAAVNKAGDDAAKAEEDKQAGANTCADGSQKDASGNCPPAENAPSCGNLVDGIGWAVCPILDAIGGLNDAMWGLVSGLLGVSPLKQEGSYYQLWGVLRVFANIILVLAFLAIIYSQLTNAGISNYGAKKMLPRLIIMAILINLSFVIVSASVDLANLLGEGLYKLIKSVGEQGKSVPQWSQLIGLIVGAGATTGAALGILATAGGIKAALILLIPVALIALLGFLAAILTLAVRQALIPLLAIFAPIAFAASLFPNTESLFKKWKGLFISMLLLYPTAAILFGGVQLAAIAMAGSNQHWFSTMLALLVMGAPLFMLPFIARQAGPMLGKLNGAMNGMAGKLRKPVGDWAGSHAKLAKARYDGTGVRYGKNGKPILRDRARALRRGFQERSMMRDVQTAAHHAEHKAEFNEKLAEGAVGLAASAGLDPDGAGTAYLSATADKAIAETIGTHQELMKGKGEGEWLKTMLDQSKSKEARAAAAGLIMKSGSNKMQMQALQSAYSLGAQNDSGAAAIQRQMLGDMKSKPFGMGSTSMAALREGTYGQNSGPSFDDEFKKRLGDKLSADSLVGLDPDEMSRAADLAQKGELSPEQLASLQASVNAARDDPILSKRINPEMARHFMTIAGPPASATIQPQQAPASSGSAAQSGATISVPHSRSAGPSPEERAYFGGDDRRD